MNCDVCHSPMTQLDPREITDPQPSRYVHRWRCDEKECPAQGEVVEDEGNCRQCGNKLTEREASEGTICDRCWEARSDYLRMDDWDEFDEDDELSLDLVPKADPGTCRVCGCTAERGCHPVRCYWVEPDLCSNCAGKTAVFDFTAHIHGDDERAAAWQIIFDGTAVPLRSPIPYLARLPGRGQELVYLLDIEALTAEQRGRLVTHIANKFNIPAEEVDADLDTHGCPILAEHVTVSIANPWRWL